MTKKVISNSYILAIDQGTSSTKTLLFDASGKSVYKASEPLKTQYLEGNWVEQDPESIYSNVLASVKKCLQGFQSNGGDLGRIKACGISNQRETFVLWDKSGNPLYNAIVWQCKRSVPVCERLIADGLGAKINQKTGLIIDPYFSGTKVIWLYENNDRVKKAIDMGEAYFGNVDTWLLYKLTRGKAYMTDYTNASRTLFFNLKELSWDYELLSEFGLSGLNLPEVKPSSFDYGETDLDGLLDQSISISAIVGDSHAAAFGEGCFYPGSAKATLGTGSSILMNTGKDLYYSNNGMVSTICWSTGNQVNYALEGVIVTAGGSIEWLKNELGLFSESQQTEAMAKKVDDNGGVYLVPAFSGLGAPHWDMDRKASISGLTFSSNKNHLVRAALESIPYQIKDVIEAMKMDARIPLKQLMVDGGISANNFLIRFLTDLLETNVEKIGIPDVSALGAAYLAGLQQKIFKDLDHLMKLSKDKEVFEPSVNDKMGLWYEGWKQAIKGHHQ